MAPYTSNKLGREEDECLGPTTRNIKKKRTLEKTKPKYGFNIN